MKLLITKTILIVAIGTVMLLVVSGIVYSIDSKDSYKYYEDDPILQKINYYQQHKNQYNTLIVGSSRLYRQVNPMQLDDQLADYGLATFNAGTANLRPFRSIDYLDYLQLSDSVDYLILELMPPTRIGNNFNANPTIHSINYQKFGMVLDMCMHSNYRADLKAYYGTRYFQAVSYKYLGFGLKKYVSVLLGLETYSMELPFYDIGNSRGFLPFEQELALHENQELDRRRDYFESNSAEILEGYRKSALDTRRSSIEPESDSYQEYLNQIGDGLAKKGVKLIFVISPRKRPWDMEYLLSIKPNLKYPVIDLSSAAEYPEFFNYRYSFDDTHLNEEGAVVFTRELAEKLEGLL